MLTIPFSGSKRSSYKYVKEIVENGNYNFVLEPFGGSAVLSVNLYNDNVIQNVIINDYDKTFDIYENFLDYKDWIVDKCWEAGFYKLYRGEKNILKDREGNIVGEQKTSPLPIEQQKYLQSLIRQIPYEYWRLLTYGSNFNFSTISKRERIGIVDFKYFTGDLTTTKQREYLNVVKKLKRETLDYKEFLEKYKNKIGPNTLLIIDPPYSDTYQVQYKESFDYKRTEELIELVKNLNCDFIFFNHNEENIKSWLKGLDYKLIRKNKISTRAGHQSYEILAYVKTPKNGCLF